jgi:hypothetical protein
MSAPALQPIPARARGNRLIAALAVSAPSDAAWLTTQLEPVEPDTSTGCCPEPINGGRHVLGR